MIYQNDINNIWKKRWIELNNLYNIMDGIIDYDYDWLWFMIGWNYWFLKIGF